MTFPITPAPSIHQVPAAVAQQNAAMTQEQLRAMGERFVTSMVSAIVSMLSGGLFGPQVGSTLGEDVATFLQNIFTNWNNLMGSNFSILGMATELFDPKLWLSGAQSLAEFIQSLWGGIPSLVNNGNGTASPTGLSSIIDDLNGTATWIENEITHLIDQANGTAQTIGHAFQNITAAMSTDIQSTWNYIIDAWSGRSGVTTYGTIGLANTIMAGAQNTLTQTANAVQAIESFSGGDSNSGISQVVNFADYPNGALPSNFNVTYSGSGASTIQVYNGTADPAMVNDYYKFWNVLYNPAVTQTDYQLVGITIAGLMGSGFGNQPVTWVKARCNAADNTYVWLGLRKDDFNNIFYRLGCTVSGVDTVWKDWGEIIPLAGTYWLEAGTSGGLRVFRVWAGSQLVFTHTEVGATSQLGSSYRYTGFAGEMYPTIGGPVGSAAISAFSFYDNQPPATVGSGATIYRTSTGATTAYNGGGHYVSNGDGFFDNIERQTSDINIDSTYGGFQATNAGWYTLKASVRIAGAAFPNRVWLRLMGPGGQTHRWGGVEHARSLSSGSGLQVPSHIGDSWTVYLTANEWIYLGYDADGGGADTGSCFTGEGSGLETYFSIALANKSLN